MYTDSNGFDPKPWMIIGSFVLIMAGAVLIYTPVGGILVTMGATSLFGGLFSESSGGKFESGWVGGLISGTFLGIGSVVGSTLMFVAANTEGLAALGYLVASIASSFGISAIGGGFGDFVTQAMNKGINQLNWDEIYYHTAFTGTLGLMSSMIPQGKLVYPLGRVWAVGFCIAGELIIDAISSFFEAIGSQKADLPRPIFV
jgi:hypothetical protein